MLVISLIYILIHIICSMRTPAASSRSAVESRCSIEHDSATYSIKCRTVIICSFICRSTARTVRSSTIRSIRCYQIKSSETSRSTCTIWRWTSARRFLKLQVFPVFSAITTIAIRRWSRSVWCWMRSKSSKLAISTQSISIRSIRNRKRDHLKWLTWTVSWISWIIHQI